MYALNDLHRYLLTRLEGAHQDNAVFIENAIKGHFEAFLQRNAESYNEFKSSYEILKKEKYEKLNEIDILKEKHKELKDNLDVILIDYNKAKSSRNTRYDKLLELEMKAKLAQKSVQDETTDIYDTKEHIKELRDEMKIKKEEILLSLSSSHRDKLEIFMSTVFSTINAYCE